MKTFLIEGGPNDIISGKCSHGTPDDTSRNIIATGGIYKGRSNRKEAPHSYLHSAAAEAAVKATEYYLIDQSKIKHSNKFHNFFVLSIVIIIIMINDYFRIMPQTLIALQAYFSV